MALGVNRKSKVSATNDAKQKKRNELLQNKRIVAEQNFQASPRIGSAQHSAARESVVSDSESSVIILQRPMPLLKTGGQIAFPFFSEAIQMAKVKYKQCCEFLNGFKAVQTQSQTNQAKGVEEWGRIILITLGTLFAVLIIAIF